ncbi:MAG: radical SAM protein [Planctomycetes bacterium]|nr:radical SAM protein [Planctomycetota bacterium]
MPLRETIDRYLDTVQGASPARGFVPLQGRFLWVMLDVAERCNLECSHCAFVGWRNEMEANEIISEEMIGRIDREVLPYTSRATLSTFHEPLVAPSRLFMLLEACRRRQVSFVDMTTNGLLLTEKVARDLMVSGINLINFSVDGASEQTYQHVRVGGTFAQFKEKLELAVRIRREMGAREKVRFRFTCCMMRSNVHEAEDLVRLAIENEIDWVELRIAMKADNVPMATDELLCFCPERADEAFAKARALADRHGLRLDVPPSSEEIRASNRPRPRYTNCMYPWYNAVITAKGEIFSCCMWHGSDRLEEMRSQPFEKAWNGDAFRRLRREMETGTLSRKGCQDCAVHFNMADPRYWKTYEFIRGEDMLGGSGPA